MIVMRAWTGTKMIYFSLLHGLDNGFVHDGGDTCHIEDGHPVMQYTGLKDQDKKEIYDSDIIEFRVGNAYENPELLK